VLAVSSRKRLAHKAVTAILFLQVLTSQGFRQALETEGAGLCVSFQINACSEYLWQVYSTTVLYMEQRYIGFSVLYLSGTVSLICSLASFLMVKPIELQLFCVTASKQSTLGIRFENGNGLRKPLHILSHPLISLPLLTGKIKANVIL
jgi:hypothetical protein